MSIDIKQRIGSKVFKSMNSTATPILIPRVLVTAICAALVTGAAAQTAEPPVLKLMTQPQAQDIELDPGQPIAIDPDTGNITIFPASPTEACQGGGCEGVQVQISEFLPTDDPIVRFSSKSLSLSWNSRGAWECRGQGSPGLANTAWVTEDFVLPHKRDASNPFTFDLDTVPNGTHTLTLQCQNGPLTTRREVSRTLEITEVTSGDCTGRNKPSGLSRDTTILRDTASQTTRVWTDVFGTPTSDVTFPDGKSGSPIVYRIDRNRYGQIDFDTINLQSGQSGQFKASAPNTSTIGSYLVSISECPGDFGAAVPDTCRKVLQPVGFGTTIFWAEESVAGDNDCPLDLQKEYYLNLVPTVTLPESQNVDWSCAGSTTSSACDITITHRLD